MTGPITNAVRRWQQGDASAQADLDRVLQPFLARMLYLVRRHRAGGLQARIDSAGVVNGAFKSFLSGLPKNEFPWIENQQDVRKLLTTLVKRQLSDEIRHHTQDKRTPAHEQLSVLEVSGTTGLDSAAELDLTDWLEKMHDVLRGVHKK